MRKRRKSEDGGFNVWRSYSDMMAGVLLLFVLLMCVTLFQAQQSYDEAIAEKEEKIALQEEYTAQLLAQQKALEEQGSLLESQNEDLMTKEQLLAEMAAQLAEQQALLAQQQSDLDEKTELLTTQQNRIDKIIGVKAEVVASLQQEFANNNVNVNIDEKTGALTLDANVMFDVAEAELTEEGKAALRQVLPIYCEVLLRTENLPYLAEIIIDGYTDTDGSYAYNLQLSQQRSLAVAQYLIDMQYDFLDEDQVTDLEQYLTVNGHSKGNPILNADGSVNMDASRRVEVKFRLKDEEMISELNDIMEALKESE